MARINIEDSIMEKAGFQKLMIKMGDRHKAMGVVWDLWRLAQEHWFPNKKPIPLAAFEEADLPECLFDKSIGLAERRSDGIYAKGSEEQFAWLFQVAEAGKKSAQARKLKFGTSKPKTNPSEGRTTVERPLNEIERPLNGAEGTSTSLLSSLSSSLFSQDSLIETQNRSAREETDVSAEAMKIKSFVGAFVTGFKGRYGVRPDLTDRVLVGKLKLYAKTHPDTDRACALIQVFFQMEDLFFEKRAFDFETYLRNIQKVALALDTGKQVKPKSGVDTWIEKETKKEVSA